MVYLEKKFRFETAHRLGNGYVGKCANIHGHSWNGSIQVEAEELDKFGMGVDYSELGVIIKKIENDLDHKLILWRKDEMIKSLEGKTEIVLTTENPTSEVLAKTIFGEVEFEIRKRDLPCRLVKVTIEETCTTRCEYYGEKGK